MSIHDYPTQWPAPNSHSMSINEPAQLADPWTSMSSAELIHSAPLLHDNSQYTMQGKPMYTNASFHGVEQTMADHQPMQEMCNNYPQEVYSLYPETVHEEGFSHDQCVGIERGCNICIYNFSVERERMRMAEAQQRQSSQVRSDMNVADRYNLSCNMFPSQSHPVATSIPESNEMVDLSGSQFRAPARFRDIQQQNPTPRRMIYPYIPRNVAGKN